MRGPFDDPPPESSPIFKAWAAHVAHDSGRGALIGVYTEREGAKVAARNRGAWGGDGDTVEVDCIRVAGRVYLLKQAEPLVLDCDLEKYKQQIREEALKKLSLEEQIALGLK